MIISNVVIVTPSPTISVTSTPSPSLSPSKYSSSSQAHGNGPCTGTLPVEIDGAMQPWAIAVSGYAPQPRGIDGSLYLPHNCGSGRGRCCSLLVGVVCGLLTECNLSHFADRAYLVSGYAVHCPSTFQPSMYDVRLPLLGATISMTVDLSAFGCGCNAGLYLVAMPGISATVRASLLCSRCCTFFYQVSRAPRFRVNTLRVTALTTTATQTKAVARSALRSVRREGWMRRVRVMPR